MSETEQTRSDARSPPAPAGTGERRAARRRPGIERTIVFAGVAAGAAACWAWLALPAAGLRPAASDAVAPTIPRDLQLFAILWAQWAAATLAILLPAEAPTALLYLRAARYRYLARWPYLGTVLFVCGHALGLLELALAGALAQRILDDFDLLGRNGALASRTAVALLLVVAGVYQWTAPKLACLERGRSRRPFVLAGWRPGRAGALRMGLEEAIAAAGCCWMLLALLFVAGPSNLAAMAVLCLLVLAERALRWGVIVAIAAGLALVAIGSLILFP